ncbi:MAG: DUF1844 domain-containing protein [Holophagales bacterium]|nr:MAG: DUF1844 domain-containing protein [Holophagales bacterium]
MKVTDRRMFDANGELREEFREELAGAEAPVAPEPSAEPSAQSVAEEPDPRMAEPAEPTPAAATPAPEAGGRRPPIEIPGAPPGLGPSFYDLLGVLADPIPLYLGDATLPDGRKVENLEMARLHIDLLDVLRQKTVGNLTSQELGVLEDFLYRARMRYVQKRG